MKADGMLWINNRVKRRSSHFPSEVAGIRRAKTPTNANGLKALPALQRCKGLLERGNRPSRGLPCLLAFDPGSTRGQVFVLKISFFRLRSQGTILLSQTVEMGVFTGQ